MRLPSLRSSAAVHPENGHGPEAPTASMSGSTIFAGEAEPLPPTISDDVGHAGSATCGQSRTADLRSADRLEAKRASTCSAATERSASICDPEAFEDVLRRLEAVYARDLAQLPLLLKENCSLRQQLQQVDGGARPVENGHAKDSCVEEELLDAAKVLGKKASFDAPDQALRENGFESFAHVMEDKLKEHEGERALCIAKTLKFTTFKLHEVWGQDRMDDRFTRMHLAALSERQTALAPDDSEAPEMILSYEGCCGRFISAPGSPYRMTWDFVGAAFIFYDLFTIPLQVFNMDEDGGFATFSAVLDWITLLFWTLNVFASLTVGYVDRGLIVMEPFKILRNYLKGWFWVDLVTVGPDWIFTIAAASGKQKSEAGSSVKLLRILRLVRMVRLVRLLKLRKIMQDVNDRIDSEYISIIASIIKMIMVLLAINHFIACGWYGIAAAYQESSLVTWIKAHHFEKEKWYYMYATAFHWSITQFTPSSMQVQPQNMMERGFAVFIVVFALVGFSYLVGGIISHIGQLRSMREDSAKQFWNLRRYLRQNSVPIELSIRIQRYLEHAWARKQATLQTTDIKVFSMLSDQLSSELKCALALPHLFVHPLFERLEKVSFVTNQRLAKSSIEHTLLAVDDNLFIPGETAHYMYVVVKGRLQYFRFDSQGNEHKEWVDKAEDWIAEPVLWTTCWVHLGLLAAYKECDLLTVNASKFLDVVKRSPQASLFLSHYGRNFLTWLNAEHRDCLSDIYQGEVISPLVVQFMDEKVYDPENSMVVGRPSRTRDSVTTEADMTGNGDFCFSLASPQQLPNSAEDVSAEPSKGLDSNAPTAKEKTKDPTSIPLQDLLKPPMAGEKAIVLSPSGSEAHEEFSEQESC